MLIKKEQSCLLLVDVQEKLTPKVQHPKSLLKRCQWLMQLANELKVPVLLSEQYPSGLGTTVDSLRTLVSEHHCMEKLYFSCCQDTKIRERILNLSKQQVILIGIETHVCVLQTALDLLEAGLEVFVVVDAVSSRYLLDHQYGLKRMKNAGITLITGEMVFFEWLRKAGTPEFKDLSQRYFKDQ